MPIYGRKDGAHHILQIMPAGISHGEAIFHTQSVFHKFLKEFISLKTNDLCRNDKGHLFSGAGDGARTRYLHLGKVALYQMSYARRTVLSIAGVS